MTKGDILVLKKDDSPTARFYTVLLAKNNLPLHSNWQEKLLAIAWQGKLLTKLSSSSVQAYALGDGLSVFETQVWRALISRDLPEIGEPACT